MSAAAAATMTAVAAAANKFYVRLDCAFGFFVEDVERRQANVRNLLFTKSDSCAFAFLVEGIERRQADIRIVIYVRIVSSGLCGWHIPQSTRDCGRGACE
jgi:hypothetical protein